MFIILIYFQTFLSTYLSSNGVKSHFPGGLSPGENPDLEKTFPPVKIPAQNENVPQDVMVWLQFRSKPKSSPMLESKSGFPWNKQYIQIFKYIFHSFILTWTNMKDIFVIVIQMSSSPIFVIRNVNKSYLMWFVQRSEIIFLLICNYLWV